MTPKSPKRLLIRTWGCQMNVYDSNRMADVLAPLGYVPTEVAEEADMVILNTCHIREKAADKVFSDLGRLRVVKEARAGQGKKTIIAVAGCVAQAEGAEIARRAPYVDLVLGPQTYHRLPEMVARASRAAGTQIETDFPAEAKFDHLPEATGASEPVGFLTVQEGCDKFCSFCVVPYTRGAEFSRPLAEVLAEARGLVARGAREIALLGQNVNAWHGAEGGLAALLHAVAAIPGLPRLRYTTSHPRDMDDALIAAHRDLPTLLPLLHLPVQSGSDRMLAAMNRGHSADDFRRVVDRLRSVRPEIAFSSDFIAGHPGETDADHDATLALIRDVGFSQSFSFTYSPRPGTPAAGAAGQVPEDVKAARLAQIQDLLRIQAEAFNISREGMVMDVLVTGAAKRPGQMAGRSPWLQPVHFDGPAQLSGQVVRVRVTAGRKNSLAAELLSEEGAATCKGGAGPLDVGHASGVTHPLTPAQENQAA